MEEKRHQQIVGTEYGRTSWAWRTPTQVLDVLVGQQRDSDLRGDGQPGLGSRAESLVHDDAIGDGGGDKGGAVVELGRLGPPVRADP